MTTPAQELSIRASDVDREAVVERLRAHAAEGRLDAEELDERVGAALAARTQADLAELTRDLPARRSAATRPGGDGGLREHLTTFVAVQLLLVAIWALSGFGYFWPIWPLMGWGIGILAHASCARRKMRRRL